MNNVSEQRSHKTDAHGRGKVHIHDAEFCFTWENSSVKQGDAIRL